MSSEKAKGDYPFKDYSNKGKRPFYILKFYYKHFQTTFHVFSCKRLFFFFCFVNHFSLFTIFKGKASNIKKFYVFIFLSTLRNWLFLLLSIDITTFSFRVGKKKGSLSFWKRKIFEIFFTIPNWEFKYWETLNW